MASGSGLFKNAHALKAHLMQQTGGISAEVNDLRNDVLATMAPLAAICVDEYAAPVAAGVALLLAATASTVAIQTQKTFLAGGIAALLAAPRNITLTTAGTAADAPATAVVTGTYRGKPQSETITVAQTAATATGLKPFSTITSVVYAAGDGAGATVAVGIGAGLGLGAIPKSRAGLVGIFREIVDAGVVTTGAITVTGLYTPATAPNAAHNYAVYFDSDATL